MEQDLKDYLTKEHTKAGMAESHLSCWWDRYQGKTKGEIEYDLKVNHDESCEIDNTENEIGRKLTDDESTEVNQIFIEAIISEIEFTNDVAVGWYDTCGDFNLNKWY